MPELDRRTLLKAGLGAAAVAMVGTELAGTGPAGATPSADFPWIIDCDSWGARPPAAPLQLSGNVTNKIIVHHTAYPNSTDYSREQAVWLARDIQDLHIDGNGWSDTGQHFTVSRGGYVLEGRRGSLAALAGGEHQMIGAHCPGENGNAIGIENEGIYLTETPPAALLAALTKLCVAVCRRYGLHAYDIFGHWDFIETQCPGEAFYRQFPMLRRAVAEGLKMPAGQAPPRRWPDTWKFVSGPVVQVGQYLLVARGYPLAVNGQFGADTVAAVQDWQARNGLPVDVDATFTAQTWETLVAGTPPVSALQYILLHKGWRDVSITGAYDQPTKKAVQDLQRLHGLTPNGKLTASTWCAAVGGVVRESFR
ncbi:peptidoglycan recognition protein family protein [Rhizomonospora bruguierae]|uniref:peptidoglycan recognition protein family protein n=1 Tax=Rhizomonospora bruguierae TaxID=1581705 RepID=UPI001BD137B6|nr:N-acetylmuramoyl-L-alanine amidase [Micromonospora sp. NBRC 107566]